MFPLNDSLQHGNILIRNLEDSMSFQHDTDPAENYIDETVYPHLRHTKHVAVVRQSADGRVVPITNFATEAAAAGAGVTLGLLDLVSRGESRPATIYGKASMVSYWLQTPAVLTSGQIYIHHAVDPNTNRLHPTLFLVNNVALNAIGQIADFGTVNSRYGSTEFVWGTYVSQYYRQMR